MSQTGKAPKKHLLLPIEITIKNKFKYKYEIIMLSLIHI